MLPFYTNRPATVKVYKSAQSLRNHSDLWRHLLSAPRGSMIDYGAGLLDVEFYFFVVVVMA